MTTIKHVAIISPTNIALSVRFNKMLDEYRDSVVECSLNQRYLQVGSTKFSFFSSEYPEKLMGHLFDYAILDEDVKLTYEQREMLMSRKKPK